MEEPLVLAMPRRELFALSGFSARVSVPALQSLGDESFFAVPSALARDLESRRVRLGLLVRRGGPPGGEILVAEDGQAVQVADVPPEVDRFGPRLAGLKLLAQAGGRELVGADGAVELLGMGIGEDLPGMAGSILIVYRMQVPAGTPAPAGCAWMGIDAARRWPLDPVSAIVLAAVPG